MSTYFAQAADLLAESEFATNTILATDRRGYKCMWTALHEVMDRDIPGWREWAMRILAQVTGVTVLADDPGSAVPLFGWNDTHTKEQAVAALRQAAEIEKENPLDE